MADNDIRQQVNALKSNIKSIYDRRRATAIALCLQYAGMVLQAFRQFQASNKFWNNQTNTAYDTVFSDAIISNDAIGFFLAHLVAYGIYLELANDRKNQALFPVVMRFYSRFIRDMEELYAA
jgi:hypothetical protein